MAGECESAVRTEFVSDCVRAVRMRWCVVLPVDENGINGRIIEGLVVDIEADICGYLAQNAVVHVEFASPLQMGMVVVAAQVHGLR